MSLGQGAHEMLVAILRADPDQARRLRAQHAEIERCRRCGTTPGCTLGRASAEALRVLG